MTGHLAADLVSAAAIAATIVTMSALRNPALKAMVYALPLPLSIALVATGGHVTGATVLGLGLLVGFLWLTRWLYEFGTPILVADLLAAGAYVLLGWRASGTEVSFRLAASAYLLGWLAFTLTYRSKPVVLVPRRRVNLAAKGAGVFTIAFLLLSARSLLASAVVTFPFSGVFAVVEARDTLEPLAVVFTRTSIAILALLFVMRETQPEWGLWGGLALGWLAYGLVLALLRRSRLRS